MNEKGLTLVPLSLYWKQGRTKIELRLARGKHVRDKRETMPPKKHGNIPL